MITLTIQDVPETLVRKLERRAERNRRSLQSELVVILEDAVSERRVAESDRKHSAIPSDPQPPGGDGPLSTREKGPLTIEELWNRGRGLGLSTPNESTEIIRKFRDERFGR